MENSRLSYHIRDVPCYLELRVRSTSVASFSGTYYFGTSAIAPLCSVMSGVAIADRAGHLPGNYPNVGAFVGSYQLPEIGRIDLSSLVFYMISPSKGIVFEMDTSQHQRSAIVIEQ
jgi:hypothetical protein